MGMFDSVYYTCTCGNEVEWQSKADECMLKIYVPEAVPMRIAADINGQVEKCKCGKEYVINGAYLPERVAMLVTVIGRVEG